VLAGARGHRITRVDVADPGVLRGTTARQLSDGLRGRWPGTGGRRNGRSPGSVRTRWVAAGC
jgi:hypothetical protein